MLLRCGMLVSNLRLPIGGSLMARTSSAGLAIYSVHAEIFFEVGTDPIDRYAACSIERAKAG
jgi:hypothetical protein